MHSCVKVGQTVKDPAEKKLQHLKLTNYQFSTLTEDSCCLDPLNRIRIILARIKDGKTIRQGFFSFGSTRQHFAWRTLSAVKGASYEAKMVSYEASYEARKL